MCGRYVATADADGLVRMFVVDDRAADPPPPNTNVAPTETVPAVVEHDGRRLLTAFRWGLVPHWADDLKIGSRLINARSETAADKPAFRDAVARRRCLLPADGFYEWHRKGAKPKDKTPWFLHAADDTPIALAGLWATWRDPGDPDAPPVRTCTVLTTQANATVEPLHDRMPVILGAEDWDAWLDRDQRDAGAVAHLLRPAPDDLLVRHEVSRDVGNPRTKRPDLPRPLHQA